MVEIAPDVPGDTATWVVRTLFATPDRPVALARVYGERGKLYRGESAPRNDSIQRRERRPRAVRA